MCTWRLRDPALISNEKSALRNFSFFFYMVATFAFVPRTCIYLRLFSEAYGLGHYVPNLIEKIAQYLLIDLIRKVVSGVRTKEL